MGSWDCYCAICGGPGCGAEIAPKARSKRFKRRLAKKAAKRKASNIPDDVSVELDSDTETYEEYETRRAAGLVSSGESESQSDSNLMSSEAEEYNYDKAILKPGDITWSEEFHVLGVKVEDNGTRRAFISGPGKYTDYGSVDVTAGDDPNFDPNTSHFVCYYTELEPQIVFPFHWPCWELLVRCITGGPESSPINKEALYDVMSGLTTSWCSRLELKYGNPEPPNGQFWMSRAGEEIFLAKPTTPPGFEKWLRAVLSSKAFKLARRSQDSVAERSSRVREDVFRLLPYDIVHRISTLLPTESILKLTSASWHVYLLVSANNDIWRRRIADDLAWFYELPPLLDDPTLSKDLNLRKVLAWAEQVSNPRRYMKGRYLAIGNRRRVWGVCQQLKDFYGAKLWVDEQPLGYEEGPSE